MSRIKCIVVDDDSNAIAVISKYITSLEWLELTATFDDPVLALNYIRSVDQINLLFLDVDMPTLNGLELARISRSHYDKLIFTTSHAQYALDAFEVKSDDFLLKPFSLSKFISKVQLLFPSQEEENKGDINLRPEFFFAKDKNHNLRLTKIYISEIIAVESLLNYIRIFTQDQEIVTHLSLKEAKEYLKGYDDIVQLHRSFLISKSHINSIEGNILTMTNGGKFTIGDNYRDLLNSFLAPSLLRSDLKK